MCLCHPTMANSCCSILSLRRHRALSSASASASASSLASFPPTFLASVLELSSCSRSALISPHSRPGRFWGRPAAATMTTEEMKATVSPNSAEGEEQLKRRQKQKKTKKTDGDHGEENGNLGTDGKSKKKKSKKRTTSDLDSRGEMHVDAEVNREVDGEYDVNEPTMEEKLASLGLIDDNKSKTFTELETSPIPAPPSADSVHLLLKQALHADDHVLLLDCLYSRDEKVIAKSTSLLNPADVLKLLKSLTSMIQQRGAVLICALPWLRSLLGQHASSIASQESSLLILNTLYQLIDARISTFRPALQLSTCLDVLAARIPDIEAEEESTEPLVIYEDKDSDEEDDEDAMETDEDNEDLGDIINSPNDSDGSEVMSD